MHQKKLLYASLLLIAEALLILFTSAIEKSGYAFGLSPGILSNVNFIMVMVFIATLISILIFLRFMKPKKKEDVTKDETKISEIYAEESLEGHKSKAQIIRYLERKGYRKKEIDAFLAEWEKSEEKWEKLEEGR